MEIIAKKEEGIYGVYLWGTIICASLAVIFSVVFLLLAIFVGASIVVWCFAALAVAFIVVFVATFSMLAAFLKTPETMIKYENGVLKFAGGEYAPKDITEVSCKVHSEKNAKTIWGTLKITAGGKEYQFEYVKEVTAAEERLNALRGKEKENG